MDLNNLLNESAQGYKSLQADAARLAEKWTATGLLEGLSNEHETNSMAMILENQAKELVKEASTTGTGGTFNAGQGEQWAGVALPLVRKVFAQIAAKDFVSVQPMNLPSGLVFYLDFKYGTTTNGRTSGDNMYGTNGVTAASTKAAVDVDVDGGLYGAGAFGYSMNQEATANISDHTSASVDLGTIAGFAVVDYDSVFSSSYADSTLFTVSVPTSNFINHDDKGVRAFVISGSNIDSYFPEYTKVVGSNIRFVVSGSDDADGLGAPTLVVKYQKQPGDDSRGDFEDVNGITIPEINVELASEAIVAKTRKLKAQWTPEFAQDLNAYHSVDAEAELTSILSEYISMEIDLEILDMLIQDAVTTERWSAKSNRVYDGNDWANLGVSDGGYYNTQGQWFQTLGTKIQKVSNKIHQKTLRGGANFIVCSPEVATILESIPGYAAQTDGDKMDFAMGVQKVGSLASRFKVYKNPYMTENVMLMGYRGSQFLETGAVYAPYVPLMMTPLVYDPDTFTPRKGIMTRYAKKMIRPEFYGKIFISDLATI